VTDVGVAVDAQGRLAGGVLGQHLMHHVLVAMEARALCDTAIARLDLNWVVKVVKGKLQGMVEAIVAFDEPFADRVVR
jgi:hypothetical protein